MNRGRTNLRHRPRLCLHHRRKSDRHRNIYMASMHLNLHHSTQLHKLPLAYQIQHSRIQLHNASRLSMDHCHDLQFQRGMHTSRMNRLHSMSQQHIQGMQWPSSNPHRMYLPRNPDGAHVRHYSIFHFHIPGKLLPRSSHDPKTQLDREPQQPNQPHRMCPRSMANIPSLDYYHCHSYLQYTLSSRLRHLYSKIPVHI